MFQKNVDTDLDSFIKVLMKVSEFVNSKNEKVAEIALKCTELLYKELFAWCKNSERTSEVNNSILVHLQLIKVSNSSLVKRCENKMIMIQSEDKKFKPTWSVEGCLKALEKVISKNYMPETTRDTLKAFMQRQVK